MHELASLLLFVIAAVCVAGGLVASTLVQSTRQIVEAIESNKQSASTSSPGRFKVQGVDVESGMETELVVDADDEQDATAAAQQRGVKVATVTPV